MIQRFRACTAAFLGLLVTSAALAQSDGPPLAPPLAPPLTPAAPARPAPRQITFDSLLREMVDRDALIRFPDPAYTTRQASSYDPASVSPDKPQTWFANNDYNHFLRVDDSKRSPSGKEFVLLDVDGPGALVRLWSANPPDGATLRFYFDGSETPAIEAPFQDYTNGRWKVGEPLSSLKAKGYNSYLPIPYARHVKVTADKDGFYYQVNYRTYAAGADVKTMTMEALESSHATLEEVQAELLAPRAAFTNLPQNRVQERWLIPPGQTHTITLPAGSQAVRYIAMGVSIPDDSPSKRALALQNVVIEAEFDGEQTVWCPLGAFFGGGVGFYQFEDWYRTLHPGRYLHSRWIMPYKNSGSLKFTNTGKEEWNIVINYIVTPIQFDDRTMHFHSAWRYEYPIHTLAGKGTRDFNYVSIKGRGVFVGDNLAVMNPVKEWWGEGDEKISVDGEKFPSHFGTGTEDYYGYAWCDTEPFSHPFHSQIRCDGHQDKINYGATTLTRVRSLDAIPFTSSFNFDMEVWHWAEADVAYGSTVYYYALPGATDNIKPQPESSGLPILQTPPLPPPFSVPGAIEAESLSVADKSEGLGVVPQDGFGPKLWSRQHQLWVQGRKPGDFVELTVPVPAELRGKEIKVTLYATKSWDYGIIRFSLDGKPAGPDIDLFNTKEHAVAVTPLSLGAVTPTGDSFVLRAEVVGGNPKAEGNKSYFGLDCIVLE